MTEKPVTTARNGSPVLVKRYGRSRTHDAVRGRYVSVAQRRGWAAEGTAFTVIDTETGLDVTRVLLA